MFAMVGVVIFVFMAVSVAFVTKSGAVSAQTKRKDIGEHRVVTTC